MIQTAFNDFEYHREHWRDSHVWLICGEYQEHIRAVWWASFPRGPYTPFYLACCRILSGSISDVVDSAVLLLLAL